MKSLILLVAVLLVTPATTVVCPKGYSYFDTTEICYKVYENPSTFFAASIACSNDDAELVSIHNAFENSYIAELIPDNFMDHWIGLQNMLEGYEFTWLDDTNVGYVKWAQGEPNRMNNCVRMAANYFDWSTMSCTVQLPFICGFNPAQNRTCPTCPTSPPCPSCPPPPVCEEVSRVVFPATDLGKNSDKAGSSSLNQLNCPDGYTFNPTYQRCYKISGDAASFFQASELCSLDNAELVSIHSQNENQFIGDLLPSADYDQPFWIGLTNLLDNWGEWNWLDGSNLQYFNWYGGAPNATSNCVMFHSLTAAWTTQYCGLTLPFICEFDPTKNHECAACPKPAACPTCPTYPPCPKATTPKPPPCEPGWTYFDTTKSCYYYVKGGSNNGAAQSQCRSMGAYISSVHSDAENDFLYSIAGRGTLWLGLHRTGAGSGCVSCFANDDGTPLDYYKWNSGEPNNSGGNEYCVEMYMQNGSPNRNSVAKYWNDIPCNSYCDYFICKKPAHV